MPSKVLFTAARRETNSWRWPAFAFAYLLAVAWGASFLTHRLVGALVGPDWLS